MAVIARRGATLRQRSGRAAQPRGTRKALVVFIALLCLASPAAAQHYPTKPIRLVVPFAPGGGVDNFARPLAQKLTDQLGQQVVVDNRPGASSIIGAALVALAPPDGYTLLCTFDSPLYISSLITKNVPYHPLRDFTPIISAATDLLGGHVKMGILVLSTVHPHISSGKLRAVAVTGQRRAKTYPELPTLSESGVPGFAMPDVALGVLGPARLSQALAWRINGEVQQALAAPEVRSTLEKIGYEPTPGTPDAFSAQAAKTYAMYQRMVKETGLTSE